MVYLKNNNLVVKIKDKLILVYLYIIVKKDEYIN